MSEPSLPTDPEALVRCFTDGELRFPAYTKLAAMGAPALPAVRAGLGHANWQVRRWCAILLDHLADPDALQDLLPLLHDPKANVRLWAVHSLSCDRCKAGDNPLDVVPHLIERIETDESIKVRRMAVAMLAERARDDRAIAVLERTVRADDAKLAAHARRALARWSEA